jgi:hypothetical protein
MRVPYTIPGDNLGEVTLHVQLRNAAGESFVLTDTVELR